MEYRPPPVALHFTRGRAGRGACIPQSKCDMVEKNRWYKGGRLAKEEAPVTTASDDDILVVKVVHVVLQDLSVPVGYHTRVQSDPTKKKKGQVAEGTYSFIFS